MAEVQSIKEEFLTCSICTEIYTDPCTLGCQHSYCRKCVTDYIKTRPDAVQSRTIPCAMCRQDTPVPNPTRPVTEWAKQLRPSLMLQGLMDKLHSGPTRDGGKDICFLCKEVGETTQASSWCSDCAVTLCNRCAKMHTKAPSLEDHIIVDLSEGIKVKQRRQIKCKQHKGEQIKFICKDCNKSVCQTCCILAHRKCEHVVTIESMVPEIRSALTEKRSVLRKALEKNTVAINCEEFMIDQLKEKAAGTVKEIKITIENAVSLLRKKEKDLVQDVNDVSGKQITEHQANVKSVQISNQMYQQHCEYIDQALQSESEVDMYDMYQVCLSGAVESVGDIESNTRNTPVEGEITFTKNVEPVRKAVAAIGKVDITVLSPMTLVLIDTIDTKHSNDVGNPDPIDVTVLEVNGIDVLVFADTSANQSLKSVYNKAGKRKMFNLKLSEQPSRLAKISENSIAALSYTTSIHIVDVRPELVLISKIESRTKYTCLTSLSNSLAAGSSTPPAVDILDMSGNVLESFTPYNTGLNLIQSPSYLCTTHEGNILASDYTSSSVYCLTLKGDVIFTYTPTGSRALSVPCGITVTHTGDVLVADSGKHTITQLTANGLFVKDILTSADGMSAPWGLCFGDNTKKLYLCDIDLTNNIKVVTFR